MHTPFGFISALPPLTTNVGASFGPRVSTAGYEWRERHKGYLEVRLYADLDGRLWQDDFDVLRRGGQALVPFSSRASKMIQAGAATVDTEELANQPNWFRTSLRCCDAVEGFERRMAARVDFPLDDLSLLEESEESWVRRFDDIVQMMGKGLHVGLNDSRNRRLFYALDVA